MCVIYNLHLYCKNVVLIGGVGWISGPASPCEVTKGNGCTTTINHNSATVGSGGMSGAVVTIVDVLIFV